MFVVLMIWVKDGSDCNVNTEISCNNATTRFQSEPSALMETITDRIIGFVFLFRDTFYNFRSYSSRSAAKTNTFRG